MVSDEMVAAGSRSYKFKRACQNFMRLPWGFGLLWRPAHTPFSWSVLSLIYGISKLLISQARILVSKILIYSTWGGLWLHLCQPRTSWGEPNYKSSSLCEPSRTRPPAHAPSRGASKNAAVGLPATRSYIAQGCL